MQMNTKRYLVSKPPARSLRGLSFHLSDTFTPARFTRLCPLIVFLVISQNVSFFCLNLQIPVPL